MQSGGDPQAYQEVKQLIELMFDVEAQLVRNDQIGTQYSGQSGTAITNPGTAQTGGRRMGSLSAFAGTQSFNPSGAAAANITTNTTQSGQTWWYTNPNNHVGYDMTSYNSNGLWSSPQYNNQHIDQTNYKAQVISTWTTKKVNYNVINFGVVIPIEKTNIKANPKMKFGVDSRTNVPLDVNRSRTPPKRKALATARGIAIAIARI
jgi:hypothetical protein